MRRHSAKRDRGVALLAFVAVVGLVASWFLVKQLNLESGGLDAARKQRTAEVLSKAKRALIGYVAHQAAVSGEDNPGAFPCPEAPAGYDSTTGTDGRVQTPSCTLPAVGRFPWRTIGTDKLVDAYGEPLWYVVASGWSKPSSSGNTIINSNCTDATSAMTCWTGQLTVDGQANAAVALIIAPGPTMNTVAAAGCTAVNQVRPVTGPPNLANWLECENATSPADANFVTTGPSRSFNDQVIKITAAEVLPAIEAAIADRFQKEFAPQIRTAYSGGVWAATPVSPFAVAFADPTASPANRLQGSAGTAAGLLPGSYAFSEETCTCDSPDTPPCVCKVNTQGQRSLEPCTTGTDSRCDPSFVAWRSSAPCGAAFCTTAVSTAGATLQSYTCTVAGTATTPTMLTCVLRASASLFDVLSGNTSMTFRLNATAANAGMALRQAASPGASSRAPQITGIDTGYATTPIGYSLPSNASTINSDGSATVAINARFASGSGSILAVLGSLTCTFFGIPLCYQYTVTVPMGVLADNPVVSASSSTYNWFYRNRWHEVSYYAVASGILPSGARSCTTSGTCLQLTNHPDAGKHRSILAIGGPKLGTQVRPATALADLFEGANADGASPFETRSATLLPNRTFNDRFAVIDSN
ncbi:MAG: hypothetical protein WAO95_05935 [Burkholderiales bacterium]